MNTWYARISWVTATPVEPDLGFDLLDELTSHSPSGTISRDGLSGAVSIAVEANTFDAAEESALTAVRNALSRIIPSAAISGMDLRDEDTMNVELAQPVFPEVVGYAEIADMAGVTRQRARAFRKIPDFPEPVIETAQGPLMAKAAVADWVAHRNTKSGRRKDPMNV